VASIAGLSGDLDLLLDSNLTLHGILVRPERTRLLALGELVASGRLRPIVEQVLPLEEAALAHHRLETGHGQGKIVLAVREEKVESVR
jgi:NADPH:quinone reductase-like Zn-dependent oxidoreductase